MPFMGAEVDPAWPIVIAHRGASAYLPEHTLEGKALAYGFGSDYLEQDVIATQDGALIVLHDLFLERVTDVERRFPGRNRSDGHYYAIDFTLADIRQLKVLERRRADSEQATYPGRFPRGRGCFRVATLAEEIELIQGINQAAGRSVGLYTEIKQPAWHRSHGIDLSRLLLDELTRYGYSRSTDPVFVQCFDPIELRRVREELNTSLNLVQLVDRSSAHAKLMTVRGMSEIAEYAQVVGWPFRSMLANSGEPVPSESALALLGQASALGLAAHAYTFRREDLPSGFETLEDLLALFLREIPIQGFFCDQPDVAIKMRSKTRMATTQ
jgi:glycerophosphoryl diester phosphodiesterase